MTRHALVLGALIAALAVGGAYAGDKLATQSYVQSYVADAGLEKAGWTTAYEVSFASLATQSLANGSVVIDGKTWTAANSTCLRTFAVTNGTGLQLHPSTTLCSYDNSANGTQPNWTPVFAAFGLNLRILVSSLLPAGITWPRYQLRASVAFTSSGIDQNSEYFQFGFQRSDDVYGWRAWNTSGRGSATPSYSFTALGSCGLTSQNTVTIYENITSVTSSNHAALTGSDATTLTLGPNTHFCDGAAYSGTWPTAWTPNESIQWGTTAATGGTDRRMNMANLEFYMGAYNWTSALGNAVVDVKRLRLEYKLQ